MPQAFQGIVYASRQIPHFESIRFASPGFPFTNAVDSFESFEVGLREPAEFTIEPVEVTESNGRKISGLVYTVKGKITLLQTDLAMLHNLHLLSLTGAQAVIKDANGKFWNFTDNTGAAGSANGSCLLGIKPKFIVDAKKRVIEIEIDGVMSDEEYRYLISKLAAAETGGAGGVASGLTATSYARAKQKASNFEKIVSCVEAGTPVSVGLFKDDCSFELAWDGDAVSPGRTLCDRVMMTGKVVMKQMAANDLLAALDSSTSDYEFHWYMSGGDLAKVHRPGVLFKLIKDEKEPLLELNLSCTYYRNADEETPNSVDIGVTAATILELLLPVPT